MQRIYNILVSLFGESKQGGYDKGFTQYQFNSPWAMEENDGVPDYKYNLEVSFSLGKFHEWKTDNGGNLSTLIKRWGGKSLLSEYYSIVKDLKESQYFNLDLFKDDGTFVFDDIQYVKLPKTFTKIDLNILKKKKLREYLNKRKITQDIIDFYNIGYTTWDEEEWQMKDRIIVPSYDSFGDLNYWVGRDFTDNKKKIKYKNCNADRKKIIFKEDKIQWDADIILVEGIFDGIYYHNAIPLMGKVLTKDSELYKSLYEKANANITICLDSDTKIEETKRIYMLLDRGRLKNRIKYVRLGTDRLPYKDFGEAYEADGKIGIINIMRSTKKFSEIDLLI